MRASGEFTCLYRFSTRLLPTMLSPVAKNATRRLIRCCSAGFILERRSETSVEKSTSSTVQVFLIAVLNISKKTGYFIGRRVRLNPGSRIIFLLAGLAGFRILQRTGDGLGRFLPGDRYSGFGDLGRRTRSQIVRSLQTLLPGVHVHGGKLPDGGTLQEQIQRLTLIDIGSAAGRH